MGFENNTSFLAVLTTVGRVTGRSHSKTLRAVKYNDMIYFSRRRPDSDWFKNIIKTPSVTVRFGNEKFYGDASVITDKVLSRKISSLKYPDERRANEGRVIVQVSLCGRL